MDTWTIDALHEHVVAVAVMDRAGVQRQFDSLREQLQERSRQFELLERATAATHADTERYRSVISEKLESEVARSAERYADAVERITDVDARLSSRLDIMAGRAAGVSVSWGVTIAGFGLLATVMSIVVIVVNLIQGSS